MVVLQDITFGYSGQTLFQGLSLSVVQGKITCLLGCTGSGKTTILRLIAGLEMPEEGKIFINDRMVFDEGVFVPPAERNVGLVFQELALWPHLTVYENISWGLRIKKDKRADEKTMTMLDTFNISSLSDRYPHQLSGGQQQLAALARSLVSEPEVLLLDEPLTNLDGRMKSIVMNQILGLTDQFGITIICVTHDNRDALRLGDEIILISEDREIAMSGSKESVMMSDAYAELFPEV